MPQFYRGQTRGQLIGLWLGSLYLVVMLAAILVDYALIGASGALFGLAAMIWAIRRDADGSEPPTSRAEPDTDPLDT